MSRFEKGQTVYMGRGDKMKTLVVEAIIDNQLIPVYQYRFKAPNDGFACGEQSLREEIDGEDLKMSECFKHDTNKIVRTRVNTIAHAKRYVVSGEEVGAVQLFPDIQVLFRPSIPMVKWIKQYAAVRLIIHVGSGQGNLVYMLKQFAKAKAVGIEPNMNKMQWITWRLQNDRVENLDINEVLEGGVEKYKSMIKSLDKKCLLIISRPRNDKYLKKTINIMNSGMEMLYIDLDNSNLPESELITHDGISENNEKVYLYKKP